MYTYCIYAYIHLFMYVSTSYVSMYNLDLIHGDPLNSTYIRMLETICGGQKARGAHTLDHSLASH